MIKFFVVHVIIRTVTKYFLVDCIWAEWGAWGDCSSTCKGGTQSKTREVGTAAQHGGVNCTTEACSTDGGDDENCNSKSQSCNDDVNCPSKIKIYSMFSYCLNYVKASLERHNGSIIIDYFQSIVSGTNGESGTHVINFVRPLVQMIMAR